MGGGGDLDLRFEFSLKFLHVLFCHGTFALAQTLKLRPGSVEIGTWRSRRDYEPSERGAILELVMKPDKIIMNAIDLHALAFEFWHVGLLRKSNWRRSKRTFVRMVNDTKSLLLRASEISTFKYRSDPSSIESSALELCELNPCGTMDAPPMGTVSSRKVEGSAKSDAMYKS